MVLDVVQRDAVNTPGLAAGPGGVIAVSLAGGAAQRGAGLGVEVEGVEGRSIVPDDVVGGRFKVTVGGVGVLMVAGDFGGPVQQRDVHEAVDDQAVVVLGTHSAPGLDEAVPLIVALHELVRRQNAGALALFGAGELVARHAGRRIQKAQVVVVQLDAVFHPVQEGINVFLRPLAERFVAGVLIAQPEQAGPETVGPFDVFDDGILLALGGGPGELGAEVLHVFAGLRHHEVHGFFHFRFGHQQGGQVLFPFGDGFHMNGFDHFGPSLGLTGRLRIPALRNHRTGHPNP